MLEHKTIDIDLLIPYSRNARIHTEAHVAQLAGSIREFGFNIPVLIDEKNNIIAGHGRVLAARKLGITDIPVLVASHLSDTQRKAFIIADNKLHDNSTFDYEALNLEMEELKLEGFDMKLMGFEEFEIDGMGAFSPEFGDNSASDEWSGMPECENEDLTPWKSLIVSFDSQESLDSFAELTGQKITPNTKSIWHPEVKDMILVGKEYISEE